MTGLFSTGMTYGGAAAISWGWLLVCTMSFVVALSMAEICSGAPPCVSGISTSTHSAATFNVQLARAHLNGQSLCCAAYPTSGGWYFWSSRLAGDAPGAGALASRVTGWSGSSSHTATQIIRCRSSSGCSWKMPCVYSPAVVLLFTDHPSACALQVQSAWASCNYSRHRVLPGASLPMSLSPVEKLLA